MKGLSISDVVERTGVAEGTLRMWERRHGFPVPERLPSGHRRYSDAQIESVLRVMAGRTAGLSLAAAIDRARRDNHSPPASLFAAIRRRRPEIEPQTIRKHILVALSHAIEDESLSRAERPMLFASFQRKRFYNAERSRFRELSRGADLAVVFADFDRVRARSDAPTEIPVDRTHPLTREWTIAVMPTTMRSASPLGTTRRLRRGIVAVVRDDLERRAGGRPRSVSDLCRDRGRCACRCARPGPRSARGRAGGAVRRPAPARDRDHEPRVVVSPLR